MTGSNGVNRVSDTTLNPSEILSQHDPDISSTDTVLPPRITTTSFGGKWRQMAQSIGIEGENLFLSVLIGFLILNALVTTLIIKSVSSNLDGKKFVGWATQDIGDGKSVNVPLYLNSSEVEK